MEDSKERVMRLLCNGDGFVEGYFPDSAHAELRIRGFRYSIWHLYPKKMMFRVSQYYCRTILDRVFRCTCSWGSLCLFSVWTLVPVRLDQQLSDHSTVGEIASGAADCRLTYTMANCPQRRRNAGLVGQCSAVGACVGHLLVLRRNWVSGRMADYGPLGSNELRLKDRLIWAHQ
ncbi:hypothetical protein TNCV_1429421 [Trichonephila clavipes]|nr:hypothetical protein TNCV_1429421 [Trichonephila clavipes]